MTPDRRPEPSQDEIRRRQRSRSVVMAVLLGALVVLFYAVSIVKMT